MWADIMFLPECLTQRPAVWETAGIVGTAEAHHCLRWRPAVIPTFSAAEKSRPIEALPRVWQDSRGVPFRG